jgi:hypothetical protein
MIYDLVRTSPWRLFVTHDDPEFNNFGRRENPLRILVDVFYRETCMVWAYL